MIFSSPHKAASPLILTEAPLATRSRVLGIVTVCIGTGPLGVLAIGVLSDQLGPSVAILIMAGLGVGGLGLVWRKLIETRSDRKDCASIHRHGRDVVG